MSEVPLYMFVPAGGLVGLALEVYLDQARGTLLVKRAVYARNTQQYRGTSPTRKHPPLGPYHRPTPRVLGGS